MARRWQVVALVAFAMALVAVVVLSLVPAQYAPSVDEGNHGGHLAAYATLALLGGLWAPRRWMRWAIPLALVLLGGTLELVQSLVPSRVADPGDALANTIGVALGSLLALGARHVTSRFGPTGPPPGPPREAGGPSSH